MKMKRMVKPLTAQGICISLFNGGKSYDDERKDHERETVYR